MAFKFGSMQMMEKQKFQSVRRVSAYALQAATTSVLTEVKKRGAPGAQGREEGRWDWRSLICTLQFTGRNYLN